MDREIWLVRMVKAMESNLELIRDSFIWFATYITQNQDPQTMQLINNLKQNWEEVKDNDSVSFTSSEKVNDSESSVNYDIFLRGAYSPKEKK